MSESKHTSGPWFAVEADSMKYCSVVEFEYGNGARGTVGLVGSDGVTVGASDLDEQNANACLIAAAPALLTACIWAEAAIAPFSKSPTEKSGISMLRAAIAKARGETT